jgi:hypothetical protein
MEKGKKEKAKRLGDQFDEMYRKKEIDKSNQ